MFVNSDFTDLLRLFNDNSVRYLVIGGYAVIQHAEPRFTKDLIDADRIVLNLTKIDNHPLQR